MCHVRFAHATAVLSQQRPPIKKWCAVCWMEQRRDRRCWNNGAHDERPAPEAGGQLACPVLLLVVLERPWLPTGISTRAPVIHPVRVHK
jgi:hypothetical protein